MKFSFRKIMAAAISASIAFGAIIVPAYAGGNAQSSGGSGGGGAASTGGGGASYAYIPAASSNVSYIYNYLDSRDKININGARAALESAAISEVANAMGDGLITEALLAKYGGNIVAAKSAVASLLTESLKVYFSDSVSKFDQSFSDAETALAEYTDVIFGKDLSYDWLRLYTVARKNASSNQSSYDRYYWALGKYQDVFDSLDALQVKNMDLLLSDYGFKTAFEEIGWTSQAVVDACRQIVKVYDSNNVGEWALIKAAARSAAIVYVDDAEYDLEYAGVNIENNIRRCNTLPAVIDVKLVIDLMSGADNVTDIVDFDASTVVGSGTAAIEKFSIPGTEDNDGLVPRVSKYARITFSDKGIYDITIHRYSGTKDWLSRFRVIVAYDIDNVVWNNVSGSAVTFNPVTDAETYTVNVYKDGKVIDTVEFSKDDELKIDFANYTAANGSGSYYADAVAYGSFPEEEYSKPTESGRFDYTATVGDVSKPEWTKGGDDKLTPVLTWDAADNATGYIVTLYGDELDEPVSYTVGDVTTYDFTSDVEGKYGKFYATVQAFNSEGTHGSVSEPSDDYVIERRYSLSGKVLLEGSYVSLNTPRKDNSGTKITIAETGTYTYSAEDGTYSFEDLPYIPNGYTLIYEHKSYLKSKKLVSLSEMSVVVPDEFLYFGDFTNFGKVQINISDLSTLLTLYGYTTDDAEWDEDLSMGDDNIILDELSVVIRNYNKEFSN